MSEIAYICPSCRTEVTVSKRAGGKTLPCPHCGQKAVVPKVAASAPCLIFQEAAPEPIVRLSPPRRRTVQHPLKVPIWGMFLILLVAFLGVLSYGGWYAWDRYYRQPRFASMYNLCRAWNSYQYEEEGKRGYIQKAERAIAYMKRTKRVIDNWELNLVQKEILDHQIDLSDLGLPASNKALREACERIEGRIIEARSRQRHCRQKRTELEHSSQTEHGLTIPESQQQVAEFLKSLKGDKQAEVNFGHLVKDDWNDRLKRGEVERTPLVPDL